MSGEAPDPTGRSRAWSLDDRPSWQQDDCPPWCVAQHSESDHPHDRKHMSIEMPVPVLALGAGADGEPTVERDRWRPVELVMCLHRRDGSAETWVYVGDGFEQRIEIGLADMERVVATFGLLTEGLPR